MGTKSDSSSVSLSDEETESIKLKEKMHVNLARGHLNMARGTRSNINRTPGKFRKNKNIFNKEMVPISIVTQNKKGIFTLKQSTLNSAKDGTSRNRTKGQT